jgi:hypothetical protein
MFLVHYQQKKKKKKKERKKKKKKKKKRKEKKRKKKKKKKEEKRKKERKRKKTTKGRGEGTQKTAITVQENKATNQTGNGSKKIQSHSSLTKRLPLQQYVMHTQDWTDEQGVH